MCVCVCDTHVWVGVGACACGVCGRVPVVYVGVEFDVDESCMSEWCMVVVSVCCGLCGVVRVVRVECGGTAHRRCPSVE